MELDLELFGLLENPQVILSAPEGARPVLQLAWGPRQRRRTAIAEIQGPITSEGLRAAWQQIAATARDEGATVARFTVRTAAALSWAMPVVVCGRLAAPVGPTDAHCEIIEARADDGRDLSAHERGGRLLVANTRQLSRPAGAPIRAAWSPHDERFLTYEGYPY